MIRPVPRYAIFEYYNSFEPGPATHWSAVCQVSGAGLAKGYAVNRKFLNLELWTDFSGVTFVKHFRSTHYYLKN